MVVSLKDPSPAADAAPAAVADVVAEVLANIREKGDAAVREYSERFDKWAPAEFRLTEGEVATAVVAMLHMSGLAAADIDLSAGMAAR